MNPLDLDSSGCHSWNQLLVVFLILADSYSGTRCRRHPMPDITGGFPVCQSEWIRLDLLIPARSSRLARNEPRFSGRESPHRGCHLQDNSSWSKLFFWASGICGSSGRTHAHKFVVDLTYSLMDAVPDLFCIFSICLPTNCWDFGAFGVLLCQDRDKVKNWVRWCIYLARQSCEILSYS